MSRPHLVRHGQYYVMEPLHTSCRNLKVKSSVNTSMCPLPMLCYLGAFSNQLRQSAENSHFHLDSIVRKTTPYTSVKLCLCRLSITIRSILSRSRKPIGDYTGNYAILHRRCAGTDKIVEFETMLEPVCGGPKPCSPAYLSSHY